MSNDEGMTNTEALMRSRPCPDEDFSAVKILTFDIRISFVICHSSFTTTFHPR